MRLPRPVCAVWLLGVLTACSGSSPTPRPTPTPTPSPVPEPIDCTGLWPTYQHDTRHTAFSPAAAGLATAPRVLASFPAAGVVQSSVVLGMDCTIYVAGTSQEAATLSAIRGGTVLWQQPLGLRARSSPAVTASGLVYARGADTLFAFDTLGTPRWQVDLGTGPVSPESSSPVVGTDGTAYVGSFNTRRLYAVSPQGAVRWSVDVGSTYATPAIAPDGTIYIGSGSRQLTAVAPDGGVRWRFTADGYLHGSPTVGADGTVYVPSLEGTLYAVDPNGHERWQRALGDGSWSSLALTSGGDLLAFSGYFTGRSVLHSFRTDGSETWQLDLGNNSYSQMATPTVAADGTVYLSTASALIAVSSDGQVLWSYASGGSSGPTAIGPNGLLYAGSPLRILY